MTNSKLGTWRYGEGITSGVLLMPDFQYRAAIGRTPDVADDFVRVRSTHSWMWRYKYAPTPYESPPYELEPISNDDILDEWYQEFATLTNRFLSVFQANGNEPFVSLIEGDDDEEFTYGALMVVISDLSLDEADWLLEREYGLMYSVRHLDTLTEDE